MGKIESKEDQEKKGADEYTGQVSVPRGERHDHLGGDVEGPDRKLEPLLHTYEKNVIRDYGNKAKMDTSSTSGKRSAGKERKGAQGKLGKGKGPETLRFV